MDYLISTRLSDAQEFKIVIILISKDFGTGQLGMNRAWVEGWKVLGEEGPKMASQDLDRNWFSLFTLLLQNIIDWVAYKRAFISHK